MSIQLNHNNMTTLAQAMLKATRIAFSNQSTQAVSVPSQAMPDYGSDVHLGVGGDNFHSPQEEDHYALRT